MNKIFNCEFYRRFGAELEINTPSGEIKKLIPKKEAAEGSVYVAGLINKILMNKVEVHGWHQTHNNNNWLLKPDSSCGLEICSPILKGWYGLKSLIEVVDVLSSNVLADSRCSFHLHVNVEDLDETEIGKILMYWIKCEAVIFDSIPDNRKLNKYCQFIGTSNIFKLDEDIISPLGVLNRLSENKYYSINAFHMGNGDRKTLEIRLAEGEFCLNPLMIKNWVRFILHFFKMAIQADFPHAYDLNNQWSSLFWLDPIDVYKFLNFDNSKKLSDGLIQVRDWFTCRLIENYKSKHGGVYSNEFRINSHKQIQDIYNSIEHTRESIPEQLYSKKYII